MEGRWRSGLVLLPILLVWGCGGSTQVREEDPLAEDDTQAESVGAEELAESSGVEAEEEVPGVDETSAFEGGVEAPLQGDEAVDLASAEESDEPPPPPPDPYQAELDTIDDAFDTGNLEAAESAMQALEATEPTHSGMAVRRARMKLRQGELEDARDQAMDVVQRDPAAFEAAALVVRANILLGDTGAAVREAQSFADARPDDMRFQNLVLYTMNRAGQSRVVLREARALLLKDEVNTETMRNIARAYAELGKYSTAKYVLNRALDVKDEPQSHVLLGKIAFAEDNINLARAELEKAIKYLPDSPDLLNNLGLICARMVDFAASEKYLVTATTRYPGLAYGHANLGYLYRLMGRPTAAVKCYQRALEIDSAYADVHYNLGLLYFGAEIAGMEGTERYEKAMDSLNQYRDLKRTDLNRKENEEIDQYIAEAKEMITMLLESQEDMDEMEMEMDGDEEGMDEDGGDEDEYDEGSGDDEEYEEDEEGDVEVEEESTDEEEYDEGSGDDEEFEEDDEGLGDDEEFEEDDEGSGDDEEFEEDDEGDVEVEEESTDEEEYDEEYEEDEEVEYIDERTGATS